MTDHDPSMRIEVPSVHNIGNRLGGGLNNPGVNLDNAEDTHLPVDSVSGVIVNQDLEDVQDSKGHEEFLAETLDDDLNGSNPVQILTMETGNVRIAVDGSLLGTNEVDSSEVVTVDDDKNKDGVISEQKDDNVSASLGELASGEIDLQEVVENSEDDEAMIRFKLEEERRITEIAQARIDRLLDIDNNLHEIHEEVERELRTLHVFDRQDLTLGVAGLVASLVVDRARGYTENGDNPLVYSNARMPAGTIVNGLPIPENTSLADFVADNYRGSEAGLPYLKALLKYGVLGEGVGREVANILTDRYTANHKMITKFKKIDQEAMFENLTDAESWAILKQAFVKRARSASINSHQDFFENIKIEESDAGEAVRHEMTSDFLGLAKVCGFEWGTDCQTVNKGSGEAAYVLVPINEPSPLSDSEIAVLQKNGKQDRIKPSTDKSFYIERDSIDRLVELAGGTNGSIANIGGYERSSFMAIINASKNPAMTTSEFSGGYLIACYDPSTPIYKVGVDDSGSTPVVYDMDDYYFPSTDSATKGTGHIKWATRTWQLTDKGHSLVQTAVQDAKNNSEALIMPFLDPRPLIRESYIEVAHKAVRRAVAKTVLQVKRREQLAAFDDAAASIDAGYNPQDIGAVSMPQLDESGQRSSWLPPNTAHKLGSSLPDASESMAALVASTVESEEQEVNYTQDNKTIDNPPSFS